MITPKAKITELTSPQQTSAEMLRLVRAYAADIGDKAKWPLEKFYNYVKLLPYRNDPKGVETLSRPKWLMLESWPWRDCDDKAILIGSWCYLNGVPFRFVAASNRPDKELHHVFVIAQIEGKDFVIDSTYKNNTLGKQYPATRLENLTGNIMTNLLTLEGYREMAGVSSVLKKAGKGISKAAKIVIKTPGVKDAIASVIPGGPAALAKARAAAAKVKATKDAAKKKSTRFIDSIPETTEEGIEAMKKRPAWLVPAAVAGGVGLLLLLRRK